MRPRPQAALRETAPGARPLRPASAGRYLQPSLLPAPRNRSPCREPIDNGPPRRYPILVRFHRRSRVRAIPQREAVPWTRHPDGARPPRCLPEGGPSPSRSPLCCSSARDGVLRTSVPRGGPSANPSSPTGPALDSRMPWPDSWRRAAGTWFGPAKRIWTWLPGTVCGPNCSIRC